MIAEIIILLMALLFFILSAFLFHGKGIWLISGYRTLSDEEKKQYDEKKVCQATGVLCVVCGGMLCVMAYLGYRVDCGMMEEKEMLPFALIFIAVILTTVFLSSRYINTKAKK